MYEGFQPYRIAPTSGSASAQPVVGAERQTLVDQLHGKHFSDCLAGRVFSQANTNLGLAIPIYTATAIVGGMPIWNPPNSGVLVELISVTLGRASGTSDFGAVSLLARQLNAIATGEICTAFAATTPKNGYAFGGNATKVKSSNAGTVTVSAGVAGDTWRHLASHSAEADATATGIHVEKFDFDGTCIVPPGVLVYVADTKATTALYAVDIAWKEIPV
jgi:hypothetical protein